jgi:hypothetical protein
MSERMDTLACEIRECLETMTRPVLYHNPSDYVVDLRTGGRIPVGDEA